jgi:3-phenylpropionate/cinnamic acid dioxygenase small subunit
VSSEVGDRLEIADLLQRYFRALDDKNYDLLETVFTSGAKLHYEMGPGSRPSAYPEMVQAFRDFNASFLLTQHMMGHPEIELDGDEARSRTSLRALHVQQTTGGERSTWLVYGLYRDRHLRTPTGWRIAERFFRSLHTEGTLLPRERVKRYEAAPRTHPNGA